MSAFTPYQAVECLEDAAASAPCGPGNLTRQLTLGIRSLFERQEPAAPACEWCWGGGGDRLM